MKFGFHQLLGNMVKTNKDIHVYRSNKLWFDIGKAKDLSEATDYFLKYKKKFIRV